MCYGGSEKLACALLRGLVPRLRKNVLALC